VETVQKAGRVQKDSAYLSIQRWHILYRRVRIQVFHAVCAHTLETSDVWHHLKAPSLLLLLLSLPLLPLFRPPLGGGFPQGKPGSTQKPRPGRNTLPSSTGFPPGSAARLPVPRSVPGQGRGGEGRGEGGCANYHGAQRHAGTHRFLGYACVTVCLCHCHRRLHADCILPLLFFPFLSFLFPFVTTILLQTLINMYNVKEFLEDEVLVSLSLSLYAYMLCLSLYFADPDQHVQREGVTSEDGVFVPPQKRWPPSPPGSTGLRSLSSSGGWGGSGRWRTRLARRSPTKGCVPPPLIPLFGLGFRVRGLCSGLLLQRPGLFRTGLDV